MSASPKLSAAKDGFENRAEQRALELLGKGRPSVEALSELTAMGVATHVARRIVAEAEAFVKSERRRRAFRGVILGAAVLVAGCCIIFATRALDVNSPYDLLGYAVLAYGTFSLLVNAWAFQYPRS